MTSFTFSKMPGSRYISKSTGTWTQSVCGYLCGEFNCVSCSSFFSKFWWHNIYTPEPRFSLSSKQQASDFWGHCLSPKGSCNASLERFFECLPIFYYIYLLCVCAHMYMSIHVPQRMHGGQKTVYRSSPLPLYRT